MKIENVREKLDDNVYLNLVRTEKFKTNLINVYLIRPLVREEVAKNALLPLVLKRGTQNLKTTLEINRKIEELYGSDLSISVNKKGERQVIRFTIEGPNSSFIKDDEIFSKNIKMLNEIIMSPLVEEGGFLEKYVKQEKRNLINKIEGRKNDKKTYAIDRCIEEMCKDEKFGLYKYGYIKDVEKITSKDLYNHYNKILKTSPIEINIVGNVEKEHVKQCLREAFSFDGKEVIKIPREEVKRNVKDIKKVFEDMDVNQGKLTLGYRTNILYEDVLYEAFLVANDILGGGPHSKLFKNVREKESLAYYVYSKSYKFKSIMVITSGIESKDYDKTLDIIKKQVDELKAGNFDEDDIEKSKNSIITSIKTMTDNNFSLSEFYLSQGITKDNRNISQIIEKIKNVKKDDIVNAVNNLSLDTIYFLREKGTGKEENN